MLVVADQPALRIGGQCRLAGPGEAEEDRDAAVVADVRGAVHREDALERQTVVHDREDRLLDLAGVERAPDQNLDARRMERDERSGARLVLLRHRLERGRVEHERLRHERAELRGRRVDEHRAREQRVVRVGRDDAHGDPMRGVGTREGVGDIERRLGTEVPGDTFTQTLVCVLGERLVPIPPDPVLGTGLADDELVLGRASRVPARVDDQRAARSDARLVAEDRVLVEHRRRRVPDHTTGGRDSVRGQVHAATHVHRRHRPYRTRE